VAVTLRVVHVGDGPLSPEDYHAVVAGDATAELSAAGRSRMERHRAELLRQLGGGVRMYGVNTGYGADSTTSLAPEDVRTVQRNTLTSHAMGTGRRLPPALVRGMLLLKAHVLAMGPSAVRPRVVELLLALLARDILPVVPEQGSQAASGDLVPQGHLGQALLGEGTVVAGGRDLPAAQALADARLDPLVPEEKEGLALVNGTAFTTAWALHDIRLAHRLLRVADLAAGLTLQALRGFPSAADPRIVAVRPHPGALAVAQNLRALTAGSALLSGPAGRIHDPYCLRCAPQVHGASRDAYAYARAAVELELNANTDNPLVFPDEGDWVSGGNFHAQPLGLPLDTLAVAMAELASLSQRRTQHLVAPVYDVGLPDRLSPHPERSIGLFMLNTTAAALVSENKALCFPASVDSIAIDTTEDHVSMASVAARKTAAVIENTARVLAIELACACQALDLHAGEQPSAAAQRAVAAVRETVPFVVDDRGLAAEIGVLAERVCSGELVTPVEQVLGRRLE
jgi:histidine ammonia-lyase